MPHSALRLMLVTAKNEGSIAQYLKFLSPLLPYLSSVQLREKNENLSQLLEFGTALKNLLSPHNIPLIINDHLEIAQELKVGLHLGQSDADPVLARKILGKQALIGLTIETQAQLLAANELAINYVGIGAIFPSRSKPETPVLGLSFLKQAARISRHPIVAIGGINDSNLSAVLETGVHGFAAIGVFHHPYHGLRSTQQLHQLMEANSNGFENTPH